MAHRTEDRAAEQPSTAFLARDAVESLVAIVVTGAVMGICIGFVATELIRHLFLGS